MSNIAPLPYDDTFTEDEERLVRSAVESFTFRGGASMWEARLSVFFSSQGCAPMSLTSRSRRQNDQTR